jgi:hypothetical protein
LPPFRYKRPVKMTGEKNFTSCKEDFLYLDWTSGDGCCWPSWSVTWFMYSFRISMTFGERGRRTS